MPKDGGARKNAIERRIETLADIWSAFAEDREPRMLRWRVDDGNARMVELFIDLQNEEVGTTPDLFVRFELPFESPETYGPQLRSHLIEQYEGVRAALAEEGLPADWSCPEPDAGMSGVQAFAAACASFRQHHEGGMMILALVLMPSRIADAGAWRDWLRSFLDCEIAATVRVVTIDRAEQPVLDELCGAEPERIRTQSPDVDMAGAVEELAKSAEASGPGHDFRKHLVTMTHAGDKGNLRMARRAGRSALKIARQENWLDMQVVVNVTMGALYLAKGVADKALEAYREAGRVALRAEKEGHPAGPKLVLQTHFAGASALLSEGRYDEAAPIYEHAGPIAAKQGDAMMEMEAWRMAAYCHESEDRPKEAWRLGKKALDAGARLDAEQRRASTLPYAAQGLLRVLEKHKSDQGYDEPVRTRMAGLLGADWETLIEQGEPRP